MAFTTNVQKRPAQLQHHTPLQGRMRMQVNFIDKDDARLDSLDATRNTARPATPHFSQRIGLMSLRYRRVAGRESLRYTHLSTRDSAF